ncbi:hypothetical protein O3M35_009917 [Rhynocoris fuscipes]|uniref:Maturase K n=1 Tax=Rhynocoris fuscipes TaxID=488301 RepID=A0AAW1D7K9_9HEMI
MLKFIHSNNLAGQRLNIKLQLNTLRNEEMCFVLQVKWHPFSAFRPSSVLKLLRIRKLSNIRRVYKKFLNWLKPFSTYGGHKICNFEPFCWQHCWSD